MSEKIFDLLLKLYPRRFRDEYGDGMRQVFRDRRREEMNSVRLWIEVLADLVVSVPREHWRRPNPLPAPPGVYRISPEALSAMVRQSHHGAHFKHSISGFLAIAVGILLSIAGDASRVPLYGTYSLLGAFVFAIALSPLFGFKSFKAHWLGYQLVIDEACLQELRHGVVIRTIPRGEVTRLVETRGYGIAVLTRNPRESLWAPSLLTRYEEFRECLKGWGPIEEPPNYAKRPAIYTHLHVWMISIYAAAMLVRSPYSAIALSSMAAFYILGLAKAMLRLAALPKDVIWKTSRRPLVFLGLALVPLIAKVMLAVRSI